MQRKKSTFAVVVSLAIGLVLAACGTDGSAPGTATEGQSPADSGTSTDGETQASGEIDPDGELIFADNADIESFDPVKNTTGRRTRWLYPVFDRLIHLDSKGDLGPGLATEWTYPEETVLEIRLREGAVFHDGSPVDAEAVKANIERHKSLLGTEPLADPNAEDIESIDVVEPTLVRLNLTEPNKAIIFSLASTLGMMMSPASLESGEIDTNPVGAGAFTVASFTPSEEAVYERFEDYWNPEEPRIAKLTLLNMPDETTRLNALRSGQIDHTFLSVGQIEDAENAGLEVELFDTIQVYTMFTKVAPDMMWADLDVRKAVNHAIDRQGIIDSILFGYGNPTVQIYPPGYFPHNEDYPHDYYEYDPDKARELLEGAVDEVEPMTFLVFNRPEEIRVMEVVQAQLEEVGFEIELNPVEPARFTDFSEAPYCCAVMAGNRSGGPDPLESLDSVYGTNGRFHPGGVEIPGFDELLNEIANLAPGPERTEKLREASGMSVEHAMAFPIFGRQIPYAHDGCVTDFDAYLNGIDEYRNVAILADC